MTVLWIISFAAATGAIICGALGKNPFPVIGIGLLLDFLIFSLWNSPEKYKDYSLTDQQEAIDKYSVIKVEQGQRWSTSRKVQ